jgi:hypothetical protein
MPATDTDIFTPYYPEPAYLIPAWRLVVGLSSPCPRTHTQISLCGTVEVRGGDERSFGVPHRQTRSVLLALCSLRMSSVRTQVKEIRCPVRRG